MTSLSVARAYQHSFDAHPNTTLAFTGGALNALGDVVAQASQKIVRAYHLVLASKLKHNLVWNQRTRRPH